MGIEFRRPVMEDREIINHYLSLQKSRSCESTFANTFLWAKHYGVGFAVIEDMLVFRGGQEETSYTFPVGKKEGIKTAIDTLMELSEAKGHKFRMHSVTESQFSYLEEIYPDVFMIEYDRDAADYVYETEKLANLSGKKYHGKKNHINKFMRSYPDWTYETMDESNVEECFQMALKWRNLNGCEENVEKNSEMCVTLNSLRLFKELELTGGALKVDGQVVAFTIGEPVCDDTMVVHIEKAFADIPGAYPMINQQFVKHETVNYQYVNREEDVGEEGLRKAKLSYHPAFLVEKGLVRRKGE